VATEGSGRRTGVGARRQTWVEAEPQPELVDGELVDPVCSRRGHHNLMDIVSGWIVCLDCDRVTVNH
jgi:hypothetical protein